MDVTLTGDVSLRRPPQSEDAAHDLKQLKIALNRLGFYTPAPDTGMTDEIDNQLADATYAFQRWATIYFDDTQIGPGSTTERVLNEELAVQDDGHGLYIWRTVQDDHVRHDHAVRDGRRFYWNDPPDGGNPGEDYNCRCWAEPIALPYHPWKEWVREREAKRRVEENLAPEKGLANVDPVLIQPGLDAIKPVYPLETVLGILIGGSPFKTAIRFLEMSLRDSEWSFGHHKTQTKWNNRMIKRGWTEEKITETIQNGKRFDAPNEVNKGNKAVRYEYEGNFVVRDEITKEIIQLGDKSFERRLK